jgi:predicted anti-sigma-YlaC factor YlaD
MDCKEFEEHIWTYDELSVPEKESLDKHLLTCAACQQAWKQAQQLKVATSAWQDERPVPGHAARLTHQVMRSINRQPDETVARSWLSHINTPRLRYACMSLSAMLIIGFMVETNNRATVTTTSHATSIATPGDAATLNSAAFHALSASRRKPSAQPQFSLLACLANNDCPPFIAKKKTSYEND